MTPPVDPVRLSSKARDQLTTLKRRTGIKTMNVLCRWALCESLADPSTPSPTHAGADTAVEIAWRVFGGEHAGVYAALIRHRCHRDGVEPDAVAEHLRLHIHRGIARLAGDPDIRSAADLLRRAIDPHND